MFSKQQFPDPMGGNPGRRKRRAAATVEFAIVAPLMFMLAFGLIEFGRMMMVKNIVISSSREGARMAVLPSANQTEITSEISDDLNNVGVSLDKVEFNPVDISTAAPGTPVTVTVTVDTAENSWLPTLKFITKPTISASTTMRRESV